MKNTEDIGKYLRNILKTAKRLGLVIIPSGGYASSYHNINNLPQYEVGLLGAISVIEGMGARDILQKRFGLTFNETMEIETGFNGVRKPKKMNKKGQVPTMTALEAVGAEIGKAYNGYSYGNKYGLKMDSVAPSYNPPQAYTSLHTVELPEYDSPSPATEETTASDTISMPMNTAVFDDDAETPIQAVAPSSPELQMEGNIVASPASDAETAEDEIGVLATPSVSPSIGEAINEYVAHSTTHGAFQALLNTLATSPTQPAQQLNALFDAAEAEIDTALNNLQAPAEEDNGHEHSDII